MSSNNVKDSIFIRSPSVQSPTILPIHAPNIPLIQSLNNPINRPPVHPLARTRRRSLAFDSPPSSSSSSSSSTSSSISSTSLTSSLSSLLNPFGLPAPSPLMLTSHHRLSDFSLAFEDISLPEQNFSQFTSSSMSEFAPQFTSTSSTSSLTSTLSPSVLRPKKELLEYDDTKNRLEKLDEEVELNVFKDNERINARTLINFIHNKYREYFYKYYIVDARSFQEYDGGHIIGAENLDIKKHIQGNRILDAKSKTEIVIPPHELLMQSKDHIFEYNLHKFYERINNDKKDNETYLGKKLNYAVIFHCEFSQLRGPSCRIYFNNLDKKGEFKTYILDGGYKSFYQLYGKDQKYRSEKIDNKIYCNPNNYINEESIKNKYGDREDIYRDYELKLINSYSVHKHQSIMSHMMSTKPIKPIKSTKPTNIQTDFSSNEGMMLISPKLLTAKSSTSQHRSPTLSHSKSPITTPKS